MELANRERLRLFYESGIRSASHLHRLTNIPLSTIYDNLNRFEAGRSSKRASGDGRPPILKFNDRRRISQLAVHHPAWSAAKIGGEAKKRGTPDVSTRTIERSLRGQGYIKLVPKEVPLLTPRMKEDRVEWCRRHLNDDFETTIFSDESSFQFYRTKIKQWTKKGKPRKPVPKYSPHVMVWGGISSRGKTSLAFVNGTINARKYCGILEGHLLEFATHLPDGWRFQQDNAPPHRAQITQDWFLHHKIKVLEWPSNSPDLNPIENIWGHMKNAVEGEGPRDLEIWKDTIVETWNREGRHFVHSMKNRLQLCIDAKGDVINY